MHRLEVTLKTKDLLSRAYSEKIGLIRNRDSFSTLRRLFIESGEFPISAVQIRCMAEGVADTDPLKMSNVYVSSAISTYCNGEIHGAPDSIEVKELD